MGAANNTGIQISYNPRPCLASASYMLESKAAILNLSSTGLKASRPPLHSRCFLQPHLI
jgi:hypothetical protein